MKILVVEDDDEVAQSIVTELTAQGNAVEVRHDGSKGLREIITTQYDAIVADRMLPKMSGLEMVEAMRARGLTTPVLFLTALSGLDDRVIGLEAGADDYLIKPFEHAELVARLHALVRRSHQGGKPATLQIADLHIDLLARTADRAGVAIDLGPREFRLLAELAQNAGRTLTRAMLLERVWGFHFDPKTSIVETHISRLRAKIDRPFDGPLIHTVRGEGYSLHDDPDTF